MRKLSDHFMQDLATSEGILSPLLKRVKEDNTLMLAIRENYINIYYRGGNLLKLTELASNKYATAFNHNYNKNNFHLDEYPKHVTSTQTTQEIIDLFPHYKHVMDLYLTTEKNKCEREFQQLVARENNNSKQSNSSEYFLTDIEHDTNLTGRFDMLGIKWLSKDRQFARNCSPVLIEMKYGNDSSTGTSGILDHLQKTVSFLSDQANKEYLFSTIEHQFTQLHQLGLMKFNENKSGILPILNAKQKPEVIFALANSNPRSQVINTILSSSEFNELANAPIFNLRFYVASFCGYELHDANMLTLSDFKNYIQKL